MKTRKSLWYVSLFLLFMLVIVGVFFLWASNSMRADAQVYNQVIKNDSLVVDSARMYIALKSKSGSPNIGIIYYPGARVQPESYVYKLSSLVIQGNAQVFITKPLGNFAIFGINDATTIINDNAHISTWYIGGHSLGGAMACEYLKNHKNEIKGLILFGSYCAADIKDYAGIVLSISGSLDALSTPQKITEYKKNLPANSKILFIEGANHSQMGNYGLQPGDNEPSITDEQVGQFIMQHIASSLSKNR